jgi:hypothetical protein
MRDNVRYATYPANFESEPGSYLRLTYTDDWHTPDIDIRSHKGTFDIFGASFSVNEVRVSQDPINNQTQLSAKLYHKVQDGSTVNLDIVPMEGMPNTLENMEIRLTSDTGETSVLDILSKLRYGRSADQISQAEQQAILQDEAVELAGVQLESSLITPFISPLENLIRRKSGLDFFYVKPGFVRNLIFSYTGYQGETDPMSWGSQSEMLQFGAGILLNNLSVNAGKYATRKLFFDYNMLVQETTDIKSKKLVVNHGFTARYDLPYSFKLGYTYQIDRVKENNSHEIMLERSFRF